VSVLTKSSTPGEDQTRTKRTIGVDKPPFPDRRGAALKKLMTFVKLQDLAAFPSTMSIVIFGRVSVAKIQNFCSFYRVIKQSNSQLPRNLLPLKRFRRFSNAKSVRFHNFDKQPKFSSFNLVARLFRSHAVLFLKLSLPLATTFLGNWTLSGRSIYDFVQLPPFPNSLRNLSFEHIRGIPRRRRFFPKLLIRGTF
jgi:hypothetical protein